MWTVKINNTVSGKLTHAAEFETKREAQTWIDSQIVKGSWGKALRQVYRGEEKFDESLVISETKVKVNGEEKVLVTLKAQYTVNLKELTPDEEGEDGAKERLRIATKDALLFKKFRDFGEIIELYFTKLINDRPITQDQKNSIQSHPTVIALITQLRFGRIAAVRKLADTIEVDNKLFFKEDIDKVNKLMDDFLTQL